jgi:hypothetical protein
VKAKTAIERLDADLTYWKRSNDIAKELSVIGGMKAKQYWLDEGSKYYEMYQTGKHSELLDILLKKDVLDYRAVWFMIDNPVYEKYLAFCRRYEDFKFSDLVWIYCDTTNEWETFAPKRFSREELDQELEQFDDEPVSTYSIEEKPRSLETIRKLLNLEVSEDPDRDGIYLWV